MARKCASKQRNPDAIVECSCGVQTTIQAVDEGYGALWGMTWLCPECHESEMDRVLSLWSDDIPF